MTHPRSARCFAAAVLAALAIPSGLRARDCDGGACPSPADRRACPLERTSSLADDDDARGVASGTRPAPLAGGRLSKLFARGSGLAALRGATSGETNPNAAIYRAWLEQQQQLKDRHLILPLWRPLGPVRVAPGTEPDNNINALGRLNTLAFDPEDPKKIYVGAGAGGFWRSNDGGRSWETPSIDPRTLAVSGIAVDPRDSQHLYLLTGDGNGWTLWHPALPSIGVLESRDGGNTWRFAGSSWIASETLIFGFALVLAPGSSDVLFAATTEGLYRGTRAADGWTWEVVQQGSFRDVVFMPGSCCVGYAATVSAVYRTSDGGDTWTPIFEPDWSANDKPMNRRIALGVTPKAPSTVYAVAGSDNGLTGVYRSDDCGGDFELRSNAPNVLGYDDKGTGDSAVAFYALSIGVSPHDVDEVLVGGVSIWKSTDGGRSFTLSGYWQRYYERVGGGKGEEEVVPLYPYVHADIHALAYHPTRRGPTGRSEIFSTNDGGISWSDDGGEHWHDVSHGLRITQIFKICGTPQDPELIYFGAQDNGSSRLGPDQVAYPAANSDGGVCLIDYQDSRYRYLSQQQGRFTKSSDGGKTFVSITPPRGTNANAAYITPLVMHPQRPEVLFTCFEDLFVSHDRGARWQNLTDGDLGSKKCVQVAVAPSDPRVIYVAKEHELYWSRDGGTSWTVRTPPLPVPPPSITDVAIDGRDPGRAWISFGGYREKVKVYETSDYGFSWRNVSAGLPNLPVRTLLHDPGGRNPLYAGTDIGVYRRVDDPRDDRRSVWLPFMAPPLIVNDLEIYRNPRSGEARLRAGTYAQGVWEIRLDPWGQEEQEE
ncbi:MAG: hypothetical protein D6696_12960 [Acidobacteria bacterium]|nr:MAG: hypothetical protein D6696_12960 [Acidobacteriota bacterium]